MSNMPDLFGQTPAQASLFGDGEDRIPNLPAPTYLPDPADIRRRLQSVLATAREAQRMPWDVRKARMWQTVFPQMANWLPDDEADQLRFEFTQEIERLKLAA
jgi:hypothetical protein